MKRWNKNELNKISDTDLIIRIINERASILSLDSPLRIRLNKCIGFMQTIQSFKNALSPPPIDLNTGSCCKTCKHRGNYINKSYQPKLCRIYGGSTEDCYLCEEYEQYI